MKINKDFIKFLVLIGSGILVWLLVEYYMSNQIWILLRNEGNKNWISFFIQ